MTAEAFVLCGGLGTRLGAAVPGLPKVLAPVGGRPFLDMLVETLARRGVDRCVLLAGYRAAQVVRRVDVLARAHPDLTFQVMTEPEPRGTGGALAYAAQLIERPFLLFNGDTYLDLDLTGLFAAHLRAGAAVTIAATLVPDATRFGTLDVDASGYIRRFVGKGVAGPALVNAGVYVIEPRVVDTIPRSRAVSLEGETFPALLAAGEQLRAVTVPGAFVDIGTPDSWAAFSRELASRQP